MNFVDEMTQIFTLFLLLILLSVFMDSDFRRLCFNRPRSKQVYLQHARFGIDFFFSFFTFTKRLETRIGIKQRNNEGH